MVTPCRTERPRTARVGGAAEVEPSLETRTLIARAKKTLGLSEPLRAEPWVLGQGTTFRCAGGYLKIEGAYTNDPALIEGGVGRWQDVSGSAIRAAIALGLIGLQSVQPALGGNLDHRFTNGNLSVQNFGSTRAQYAYLRNAGHVPPVVIAAAVEHGLHGLGSQRMIGDVRHYKFENGWLEATGVPGVMPNEIIGVKVARR
jgi:hypothetical protein